MSAPPVLRLAPEDDVVVALRRLEPGEVVRVGGLAITVREPVPMAHKLAVVELAEGAVVRKFGVPIGRTTRPVAPGEHVHVHNIKSDYVASDRSFFEEEG